MQRLTVEDRGRAQNKTLHLSHFGLSRFMVALFGTMNAPGLFCRTTDEILSSTKLQLTIILFWQYSCILRNTIASYWSYTSGLLSATHCESISQVENMSSFKQQNQLLEKPTLFEVFRVYVWVSWLYLRATLTYKCHTTATTPWLKLRLSPAFYASARFPASARQWWKTLASHFHSS